MAACLRQRSAAGCRARAAAEGRAGTHPYIFYPFIGLNFIFNGVVRGSGAMVQVLALNIVSLWILRVPLAYGLTMRYDEQG